MQNAVKNARFVERRQIFWKTEKKIFWKNSYWEVKLLRKNFGWKKNYLEEIWFEKNYLEKFLSKKIVPKNFYLNKYRYEKKNFSLKKRLHIIFFIIRESAQSWIFRWLFCPFHVPTYVLVSRWKIDISMRYTCVLFFLQNHTILTPQFRNPCILIPIISRQNT